MNPCLVGCLVGLAVALAAPRADAYPQFQLSRDQTCTRCHLSPSGGGLLSENGHAVAGTISQLGTSPEFMYGGIPLPSWLMFGGDFRSALGYHRVRDGAIIIYPMQADVYARVAVQGFSLNLTGGVRPPQWIRGNGSPSVFDRVWSREHYLMWQQNPGDSDGLYVRAGRFLPVFGLRLVEHPIYTRRFGGTPLYGETYAAAVEYVTARFEVHVTGFVEDPLIDPVVRDNGVAAYAEARLGPELALGGEAMITAVDGNTTVRVGAIGKRYFPSLETLVQAELQVVRREVTGADSVTEIVGHAMASKPLGTAFLLDVGLGHYDENIAIGGLDRDALDVNLHWFMLSHFELVLQGRIEGIGILQSTGGPTSGWALLHAHYRL